MFPQTAGFFCRLPAALWKLLHSCMWRALPRRWGWEYRSEIRKGREVVSAGSYPLCQKYLWNLLNISCVPVDVTCFAKELHKNQKPCKNYDKCNLICAPKQLSEIISFKKETRILWCCAKCGLFITGIQVVEITAKREGWKDNQCYPDCIYFHLDKFF